MGDSGWTVIGGKGHWQAVCHRDSDGLVAGGGDNCVAFTYRVWVGPSRCVRGPDGSRVGLGHKTTASGEYPEVLLYVPTILGNIFNGLMLLSHGHRHIAGSCRCERHPVPCIGVVLID